LRTRLKALVLALAVLSVVAVPATSFADHDNRNTTDNMIARGDSPFVALDPRGNGVTNSDLAFWGDMAINGTYTGFRLIDISDPDNPTSLMDYQGCDGGQGDVMVWENLLIRSWDSPAPAGRFCGEMEDPMNPGTMIPRPVAQGFEGLHVFDISTPTAPELINEFDMSNAAMMARDGVIGCGSHTASLVPLLDEAGLLDRLLIYNSHSGGNCAGIEVLEVNTTTGAIDFIRREGAGRSCHDTAVMLDDVMKAVCAGGNGFHIFSMGGPEGGTIENPKSMHNIPVQDVSIGHTAAFTNDGKYFVFGHEPGGGTQAQCEDIDPERFYTFFMYEVATGNLVGKWVLDIPQSNLENCTLHNINFVPTTDGSDILVSGNYQAGTWVIDFTDPENVETVGFADPPPLDPEAFTSGGAWSTYWYNGFMYESEISKGFHVFELDDEVVDNAMELPYLNPQTTMQRIPEAFEVESSIRTFYERRPNKIKAEVTSDNEECAVGREVAIRKMRKNGTSRTVAEKTTNNAGRVQVKNTFGGGKYFSVARVKTFTDQFDNPGTCLRAQSRPTQVPGRG
jgi:LVIVD repeat